MAKTMHPTFFPAKTVGCIADFKMDFSRLFAVQYDLFRDFGLFQVDDALI